MFLGTGGRNLTIAVDLDLPVGRSLYRGRTAALNIRYVPSKTSKVPSALPCLPQQGELVVRSRIYMYMNGTRRNRPAQLGLTADFEVE